MTPPQPDIPLAEDIVIPVRLSHIERYLESVASTAVSIMHDQHVKRMASVYLENRRMVIHGVAIAAMVGFVFGLILGLWLR